jgi:hypothetical protein
MMNHAERRNPFGVAACGIAIVASTLFAPLTSASGSNVPAPANDAWQAECGSCHVAYPPRLLPASSWRAIIHGLGRHFGSDASIDPATAASIQSFLEANAGRERSFPAQQVVRITETPWFVRAHRKIRASEWSNSRTGSAANCGACHKGAATGRFSEHDVRIPR